MKPIRVLIRSERTDLGAALVAQCLEYDIAAQGNSVDDVTQRFKAVLGRLFDIAAQRGTVPLEGIEPAPSMYWHQWSRIVGHEANPPCALPKYPTGASVPPTAVLYQEA